MAGDRRPVRSAVVVLAGGSGTRVGAGTNKVLLELHGVPILAHAVRTALLVRGAHRMVVVVRPEDREPAAAALAPHLGAHDLWVVDGGRERHDSEWQALQALAPDIEAGELEVVAIHDAARPLAPPGLFREVIDAAAEHGGAIPVLQLSGLARRDGSAVSDPLVAVQTPQAFRAGPLLAAYRQASRDGFRGTDTAACLAEYADLEIVGVPGSPANLKVTFPEDLALAEHLGDG